MATETTASDHTPAAADELIVKKVKDEAIEQMIASLANEDGEGKHDDKPNDDAQGQVADPSSKTGGGEAEGGEKKIEIEEEKSNDSPALETPAGDNVKHDIDKVEDAQSTPAPSSNAEGEAGAEDKNDEPSGIVEKSGGSVPLEANVADDSKEEKELISDSQAIGVAEPGETPPEEPTVEETPQQLEKESTETEEEKQPKTADIPEASAETIEQSSDAAAAAEANALGEPEAEVVKETQIPNPSPEKEEKPEHEPAATGVQVKTEEPEKESLEKPQEVEQPSIVAVPESSTEVSEEPSDAIEEKTREVSVEELKDSKKDEAGSTAETERAEPVVSTEVGENPNEPEKQSLEQKEEEEQTNTVSAIPEPPAETIDATEKKTREPEPSVETLKETNNCEAEPTETEKAEPVVNGQSSKQEEEAQPKTVLAETVAESAEKTDSVVEVHPPKESDTEVVKESSSSESEALPEKAEEPVSAEVEEKPREPLEVSEKVEETGKDVETKQEIVIENAKIEGASDDTIKDPISLKEEKIEKVEEAAGVAENTARVSSNEEAQAVTGSLVEPSSHEVAEKVVEEDEGKKESRSVTDAIEEASKEAAAGVKNIEQAPANEEAKAGLAVEEREYSVPTSVEEKVDVAAASGDKKEEVEINKVEEQKESTTTTAEADDGVVKVESLKDDAPAVKVDDEISAAAKETVRETLASKFEEQQQEEESAKTEADNSEPAKPEAEDTKESDATKTSRDFPKEASAKPAQKQSNNIISKVKQSLVKAKKAITGKSPSSKNQSSGAAKGDIKVK